MKNEWEEKISKYNYKCFGRSTEGEILIKTWMAQVCHRHVRMIKNVLNQRNIDNMIMR